MNVVIILTRIGIHTCLELFYFRFESTLISIAEMAESQVPMVIICVLNSQRNRKCIYHDMIYNFYLDVLENINFP